MVRCHRVGDSPQAPRWSSALGRLIPELPAGWITKQQLGKRHWDAAVRQVSFAGTHQQKQGTVEELVHFAHREVENPAEWGHG